MPPIKRTRASAPHRNSNNPTAHFGIHYTLRLLAGGGVALGYTHHEVLLGPDPDGQVMKAAWRVFRRFGMSVRNADYRALVLQLARGRLEVGQGTRYKPEVLTWSPPAVGQGAGSSASDGPRASAGRLEVPLEWLLPNGTSFVVLKVGGRVYLEMGLKGHQPLTFDVSLPGCPFEQALWSLERKWPERCRG